MIKDLYMRIAEALSGIEEIRHIDLWNRNVEFIEQEEAWERPAVFIEFEPIVWRALEKGTEYRSEPRVRLHVVTDWVMAGAGNRVGTDGGQFDLPELIHRRLEGLEGDNFYGLDLVGTIINHDHEEILDNIEIYSCEASKIF